MTESVPKPVIVWFRQDLRLADNPALQAAQQSGAPLLPLYILDDTNSADWRMGAASRWWLQRSLAALNESLDGRLVLRVGDARQVLDELIERYHARAVYWNRCYEPWRIARDTRIKQQLTEAGVAAKSFNASLLFEPQITLKTDGTPYRVFTPFFNKGCLERSLEPEPPRPAPDMLALFDADSLALDELRLQPDIRWDKGLAAAWTPGEAGAQRQLDDFLDHRLAGYRQGRDFPATGNVSRLSPHLHFGEISPRAAWHGARQVMALGHSEADGEHFLRELGWREFSHHLLYHFPQLPEKNLQSKFDRFPWRNDSSMLACWQQGKTGYPIVDAGMRELWATGYMHNRVRMIVGSFLVKNLMLHWRHGAKWFWDTLVDADLANNSMGWQWIAGSGADAAPYFRIFNPVTQGKKFDPDGDYVRRFVPELALISDKYLHCPWEAPAEILAEQGVTLGVDYPAPIVELKFTRERALAAFKSLS